MKNRYKESIAPLISQSHHHGSPLIMTGASDIGVRRNGGRNGARFAPEAILGCFKKLQNHLAVESIAWKEVSNQRDERENFSQAQESETTLIKTYIEDYSPSQIVHIGGGHDHVYPFLKAIQPKFKKIIILNFDAHCDTREEDSSHSGTPFRDFDRAARVETHLLQIGIHRYANSKSTLSPLKNIKQQFLFMAPHQELLAGIKTFLTNATPCEDSLIVLSVDCDGISAAEMEAVSAVNHNGFSSQLIREALQLTKTKHKVSTTTLGIYEYNPLFDNLSQKGARLIAGLIFDFLDSKK